MICHKCKKKIDKEEKIVLLKTFDNKKVYEELYFHINCWIQDMKEKDEQRAMQLFSKSMNTSWGLLRKMLGKNGKETTESFILQ